MAKFSPAISSLKICDVDKMFFSECTSDPSISEIRNKDYFFPKKTSIIAIQSLKNVDCAILEKFVLFKGKNQRILVAVFSKGLFP